ncbi:MAG: hypothetical protein RL376_1545 [Verrucomicrobiota bacterium]
MSTFSPSSVPSALPTRREHALDEPKPELRVGLIGTVAAHGLLLLLLLLMPEDILEVDRVIAPQEVARSFEIELAPELFTAPQASAVFVPPQFVEVNPAAPENVPDKTPFVGAQNQQVAQPVPTPDGASDTPALKGAGEVGATAIVSGDGQEREKPSVAEQLAQAFAPPTPPSIVPEREAAPPAEQAPAQAINGLGGGEQLLGETDGAVGTTVTALPAVSGAETGAEPRRGTAESRSPTGGYFAGTPAINRSAPQERPRLAAATINARNTPTIKNEFGTKNIGGVSYNAKWSSYGEYLQRLIDAVQAQWERLIMRSAYYPVSGSLVRVVFKLNAQGEVAEIVSVGGGGGELAQRLCVSAISERAPYGEWTEDMRAALGKEQELGFTFFYQ